jgi:uncharacterized protein (DUF2147 family)
MIEALLTLAAAAVSPAAAQPFRPTEETVWRNPQNSVHVRVHPCGQSMCGTVIWANDKAKADSARGGTPQLVGAQLFRDFHLTGADRWTGRIFVPDMNRVFTGTGTLKDANTLIARGCLAKNFGCKSQTWTRVDVPSP